MSDESESRKKLLHRGGSLCAPDLYTQLLTALQDHDFETFKKILDQGAKSEVLNPEHWYEDPHHGTLLDIACRSSRNAKYIQELLNHGVDPNKLNTIHRKAPLHTIVEIGDKEALQVLLKYPNLNVNILDRATASSALHIACKNNNYEILHMLLNDPKIRVNVINKKGQTAIYLAALSKHKDIVLTLLKYKGIDVDSAKTGQGKTARDIITEKLPELVQEIPDKSEAVQKIPEANQLFVHLYEYNEEDFLSNLRELKEEKDNIEALVNEDDGSCTFLQYTCEYGFLDSAKLLLEYGADPNRTHPTKKRTPIMLASHRGYYEIVRLLGEHENTRYDPVNEETVLHSVIQGSNVSHDYLETKRKPIDHLKCFKYVLNNIPKHKLDVNQQDVKGNTVLHYAAKNGNPELILMLLRHGVYIGTRNKFNEPALQDIPHRVLQEYLDECLSTNKLRKEDPKYEIILKYNFLVPPYRNFYSTDMAEVSIPMDEEYTNEKKPPREDTLSIVSETDPLLYMSQSKELRPLLSHPVLASFIHLKWFSIQRFYYMNLSFYLSFWLLLSGYVLAFYANQRNSPDSVTNSTQFLDEMSQQEKPLKTELLLWTLLVLFLIIFITRELFQIVVSPIRYFHSLENWLEILLILVTGIILFNNSFNHNEISAAAILLSWTELVLLIGRYPSLSTYIEMFKTVSLNFLQFLAWYSILILAFALSFYTLFKDTAEENDNEFFDPGKSIFKTIVMLTGEFDASSLPFRNHPITSHLLFVLFIFLIAIILFNLLNGLAVSDTQAIRTDSQLLGYISIVKLVAYIETIALGDPTLRRLIRKVKTGCCFMADPPPTSSHHDITQKLKNYEMFSNKVNLFPRIVPDSEILVYPNKNNRVVFSSTMLSHVQKRKASVSSVDGSSCYADCQHYHMDHEIIKHAKSILQEKECKSHTIEDMFGEYNFRLNQYENKLDKLETTLNKNQVLLQDILRALKHKSSSSDSE